MILLQQLDKKELDVYFTFFIIHQLFHNSSTHARSDPCFFSNELSNILFINFEKEINFFLLSCFIFHFSLI